jgi:hypothetical protein
MAGGCVRRMFWPMRAGLASLRALVSPMVLVSLTGAGQPNGARHSNSAGQPNYKPDS